SVGSVGGFLLVGKVTVVAVIPQLWILPSLPPTLLHLLRRGGRLVQFPCSQQARSDIGVDSGPLTLPIRAVLTTGLRAFVPGDTQPAQPVEQRVEGLLGVPTGSGVLDAEHQTAAVVTGARPV